MSNYNKMSYISGVIIFFSAVIFLISILWLSGARILSASEYKVFFRFSDVVGLRDRSQVFMRGYRVGWTKDVMFEKDAVLVRVDIKRRFQIPIDSRIEINTLNLIGEKAITISPGKSDQFLKPYDVLEGENKDIMILARNLLNTMKEKIDNGELDKKAAELAGALGTMKELVQKMDKKIDQVDITLINRQIVELGDAARSVREMASTAKEDVHKISEASSASLSQVGTAARNLSDLSVQLTKLSTSLNNGEGSMGELLKNKEYVQNLNQTVNELNQLVKDLQKNPGRYLKFSVF